MVEPRSGAPVRSVHAQRRDARRHRAAPRGCGGWSTGSPIASAPTTAAARARNIAHHYDLGNDFYRAWLDAGHDLFERGLRRADPADEPLEAAQARKVRAAARPARPRSPASGCSRSAAAGAGSPRSPRAIMASEVTGLTLSAEQKAYAEARLAAAGLADRVEIRLDRLSRRRRAVRRRRQRRDGRGGRPGILAGLSRQPSPGC